MTDLILIRHGETDWNRELRFQGQLDVPLNAVGHEQARRIAHRLADEKFDHLVNSDLQRTRETAAPILRSYLPHLLPDTLHDPALREQHFGLAEGLRSSDFEQQHAEVWAQWVLFDADYLLPGGESTRQFHTRVMAALQRLADRHRGQTLVVVTHGGVLDMVWRTAKGLGLHGPRQSDIPNAAFNRVRIDGAGVHILEWADVRHLDDLPPAPVYDQTRIAAAVQEVVADAETGGSESDSPTPS